MTPQISVVVPTFRRDALLRQCLDQLLDQSLAPSQYEIIVCDDGPCESTRELVEQYQRNGGPVIRYVPVAETQGPAAARNRGWKCARAEIVAFTDDDCQPARDWLAQGFEAIADADAVTGRTVVPVSDPPTDYERDTAGLASAEFITANCLCRKSALADVGGFDERFTAAWREDSDLHFSLLERGFRVARAPGMVVVHPVRPAPWGISVKLQRKGIWDPLLWFKHPRLYAERIPRYPRLYLVIAMCLVGAAVGALAGYRRLLVLSILCWIAATVLFTVRRLRGTTRDPSHVTEMIVTSILIPPLSLFWRLVGLARWRQETRSPPRRAVEA
ncbi:MAG: glycosyltransferase family 2 protein [Pirellulaceae bacterium]